MVWSTLPGYPHGGPLPIPVITSTSLLYVAEGDALTITGTNFTPDTSAYLSPGNIYIGKNFPTVQTSMDVIIPTGIANRKYLLTVSNGNVSNSVELFVTRDVTISNPAASGDLVDALLGEFN